MKQNIGKNELELMVADITEQETDAIVNAANGTLMGGGGVDGAIHRTAGKALLEECKKIREQQLHGEKLATGKAILTKGYDLSASYVIHTVGPVWSGDKKEKEELLAACYENSLKLAEENQLTSIAFPSISTGVYDYPIEKAAETAVETVVNFLRKKNFGEVVFTLFSEKDYQAYQQAFKKIMSEP